MHQTNIASPCLKSLLLVFCKNELFTFNALYRCLLNKRMIRRLTRLKKKKNDELHGSTMAGDC